VILELHIPKGLENSLTKGNEQFNNSESNAKSKNPHVKPTCGTQRIQKQSQSLPLNLPVTRLSLFNHFRFADDAVIINKQA